MKFHKSFFVVLFLAVAIPVFAIEFGSTMSEEERARILNVLMSGSGQPSMQGGTESSAESAPQVNTGSEDASGASGNSAVSPLGNNPNSTVVNPGSNVAPQGALQDAPQEPGTDASLEPVPPQEPSVAELRSAIQKYVMDASQSGGTFNFQDQSIGKIRKLVLIRVNDTMEKSVRGYSMNADFSDIEMAELINLKFELFVLNNQVNVIGIQMNTINGQPPQTTVPVVDNSQVAPEPQALWPQPPELLNNQQLPATP